jgi:hypothetical protein
MSLELQIIRASEFIRLGVKGRIDLTASKAALGDLARACRMRGICRAMVDLRDFQYGPKPVYSTQDLAELVRTFHEVGFSKKERLAILYRIDPYHRARMFAFLSTMHGWTVRAFNDFEEALNWLSQGQCPVPETVQSATGKTIPVRAAKHKDNPAASITLREGKLKPTRPVRAARGSNNRL